MILSEANMSANDQLAACSRASCVAAAVYVIGGKLYCALHAIDALKKRTEITE
jgi:hypothetical protein